MLHGIPPTYALKALHLDSCRGNERKRMHSHAAPMPTVLQSITSMSSEADVAMLGLCDVSRTGSLSTCHMNCTQTLSRQPSPPFKAKEPSSWTAGSTARHLLQLLCSERAPSSSSQMSRKGPESCYTSSQYSLAGLVAGAGCGVAPL